MKLTAYDLKHLEARRHIPAEPTREPHRRDKRPTCTVTPEERKRRHELLLRAIEHCGSVSALAMALGAGRSSVSKWKAEREPVPAKHLARIEEIAWRDA